MLPITTHIQAIITTHKLPITNNNIHIKTYLESDVCIVKLPIEFDFLVRIQRGTMLILFCWNLQPSNLCCKEANYSELH